MKFRIQKKLEAESTKTLLQEADSYSVLAGESLLNKMENFVDGVFLCGIPCQ